MRKTRFVRRLLKLGHLPRLRRRVTRLASVMLVSTALCVISGPSYSTESASTAPDTTIVLTTAQADSLLQLIDSQALQLELLRIDLREARALAQVDSLMVDQYRAHYERIIALYQAEQPSWWSQALRSPVLWLALGGYLGVQAAK